MRTNRYPAFVNLNAPLTKAFACLHEILRLLFLPAFGLGLSVTTTAATLDHNSLAIRAVADTSAPSITLEVEALRDLSAYSVDVSRRSPEATSWTSLGTASQGATPYEYSYTDTTVTLGKEYEYRVEATLTGSTTVRGFTAAAVGLERFDDRGKLILVVEDSKRTSLSDAIDVYKADLVGDGWEVYEITAPTHTDYPTTANTWTDADNPAVDLRNQIRSTITNAGDNPDNPSDFKQVILLGHVQVPYSGSIAPDGHNDHSGAWPADVYYGDLDGTYKDTFVNNTGANGTRNDNVPGDGKFDQNFHEDYELAVGRVSLHDMSEFDTYTETELLANYLDKIHRYRRGLLSAEFRGLATWQWQWDAIGDGEAPYIALYSFTSLYGWEGSDYRVGSSFRKTLRGGSYEWAVTASAGGNTGNEWSKTSHYPDNDQQALFFAHFGSYLGDWDQENNLLRAPLAQKDWGLTALWGARPHTSFQAMTLDNSIGEAHKRSLNFGRPEGGDLYDYATAFYNRMVHHGLMGDPTLRRHIIAPPQQLQVTADGSGGFDLTWEASPDDMDGYHVYRAPTMDDPFVRLTGASPITGTTYNDASPGPVGSIYMVRAVRLEETRGGSFWNASQGIFSGEATHNAAPRITEMKHTVLPALQSTLKPQVMDDGQPDPDTSLSFNWTLDSGPGTLTFDDASLRNPTVTASTAGVYTVSLTADDGALSDTVSFDLLIGEGAAPVVDAGPDIRGADQPTVRLDGRVGREPANSNLSISWALAEVYPASGQATFTDATHPQTEVTFTEAGIYTLRLRATLGGQHFDDFCTVYVQPVAVPVDAVPTSELYQFFNFENATSDTIFDQSSTGKESSIENGATITPEGYVGQALDFGGKRRPHTLTKDFFRRDQTDSFAIAHWLRFDNAEGFPRRFAQVYEFPGMGELYFSGNDTLTFICEMSGDDGRWDIDLNAILGGWPSATWQHFAVSFNGAGGLNEPTFYLNGVVIPATEVDPPSGSSVNAEIGQLRLGHRRYTDYTLFDGQLDEFRAYNRALSTAEVLALARQKAAAGSVRRPMQQEVSLPNNRDLRFHLDFDAPVENFNLPDITVVTAGSVSTGTPSLETLIDKHSFLVRVPVVSGTGTVTLKVDASGIDDPANGVPAQMRIDSTSIDVAADDGLTPPTAEGGPHQSLTDTDKDGSVTFTLDASGSSDVDGSIDSYEWFDASGQRIATGASPSVTLPTGNYTLTLRVTDNDGAADIDLVGLEAVEPPNQTPVADAGADFVQPDTGNDGTESVALDGTASTDPDGDGISAYEWRLGDTVIATGATPSVSLARGVHQIQLVVTDGRGANDSDFVEVDIVRKPENPGGTEVGLNFAYYEGEWTGLPDFENLTEVAFGPVSDFDLSVRQQDDAFGLRYTGFLEVTNDGEYTFTLESSNGAKLYLGDELIVDNDGMSEQGSTSNGSVRLGTGTHALTLDYFKSATTESAPDPSLSLTYASAEADISEQAIPAGDLSRLSAGDFLVSVEQAANQDDPVGNPSEVRFTATFDQPVIDFTDADVNVTGTTGADTVTIQEVAPNDGTTYEIAVSGFTSDGTVTASIPAQSASTSGGLTNRNSNSSDNTVEVFTALDGNPPEVLQTNPLSDTTVELVFDEPLTTASAENSTNYAGDNELSVTDAALSADRHTVTLTTSSQTPNTNYTLTLNGITDISGLVISVGTTASFTSQSNILLWYDFDDDSGTTVTDKAGSRDATVTNPDWRPGEGLQDGALYFDGSGSSEVVEANAENYLAGLSAVTITAMVKSEVTGTDKGFFTTLDPDGKGESINMRFDSAGWSGGGFNLLQMGLTTDQGDETIFETPSDTQTTDWLHVAMVWSSGDPLRVFLDGQEVNASNEGQAEFNNSLNGVIASITQDAGLGVDKLLLGKGPQGGGSSGWQGWIDDFRIYDEALADTEIAAINDDLRKPVSATYTLTTTATNGQITLDPASPDFSDGTVVTVEAVPDTGYRFVDFADALTGSTNPQTLTMDADKSVTANFEANPGTFDGFLAKHGLNPDTASTADGDNDGTSLLLEHFFAMDPNLPERPPMRVEPASDDGDPVFQIVFERNRHATDVTHSYEAYDKTSDDWNSILPESESTGSAEHPDRETVTAEFPMERDRLIMRMRVSQQ